MKKIIKSIVDKIKKGEEISPFLFIDKNLEIANSEIKNIAYEILKSLEIPKVFLYVFEGDSSKIKVEELRKFTERANIKTNYEVQIFLIENISKLTTQAGNSLLKLLEEPGKGNLIFLSNGGENNILETILSRVQIVNLGGIKNKKESLFYGDLIKNYIKFGDAEIISYFIKNKLEKEEYIDFLESLILFIKKDIENNSKGELINYLDEILEDINLIGKNNLNAKYIVDKWILKIGKN